MWDAASSNNMVAEFGSENESGAEKNSAMNYDYLHGNQIKSHRNVEFGEDVFRRESLNSLVEQKKQQNMFERDPMKNHDSSIKSGNVISALEAIKSGRKGHVSNDGTSPVTIKRNNRMDSSLGRSRTSVSPVIDSKSIKQENEIDSRRVSLYGLARFEGASIERVPRAQSLIDHNLTYGSSPITSYFLTLGLPILCCLMFLVIIWRLFKYYTSIRDEIQNKKISKQRQEAQVVIDIPDKLDAGQAKIDSSTTNSKVFDNFKTSCQVIDRENKNYKLTIDQLSISMEQENTSKVSDEPSEWRMLPKKLIGGLMINKSKKNDQEKESQNDNDVATKEKGDSVKLGKIKYSVSYDFGRSILSIEIMEAASLPGLDLCGLSDPYVKIYFEPDKKYCEKTRVHKNTLNPIFNEKFEFNVSYSELTDKTLVLAVYDFDKFSKHDEIGQVIIPINSIDLAQTHEEWRDLTRISSISDSETVS